MAASLKLNLSNRSKKQPIKRLPTTVELPAGATVEDVKILIAKATAVSDFNRIGLFDPSTGKTLKDRRAIIADIDGVAAAGEVQVKDLGPQIGWRTCYVIEYLGPLSFHIAMVAARPYIYPGADYTMSNTQWLAFAMILGNYIKREIETIFVHKFSANTMPLFNVFKNSAYYWIVSGLGCAYFIYHPTSLAAKANEPAVDLVGLALYVFGQIANARVHLYQASLRSTGGTERKIPVGYGFSLVTCPNYMYEMLAWAGIIIVSRSWAVILFISIGGAQMYIWGKGKERAYRKEFGDRYKKKRYVMLPGLL